MKFRSLSYGITAAAVVVSCMVPMRVVAQGGSRVSCHGRDPRSLPSREAAIKAAEAKPTPRTADGHPDLNGYWDAPQLAPKSAHVDANGNLHIGVPPANGGTGDPFARQLCQLSMSYPNPPPYKPELLAKVKDLATHEIDTDPEFHCIPRGVPRSGPPRQIVETPKLMLFLYQIDGGIGDQPGLFASYLPMAGRIAPTWIPHTMVTR